MRDKDMQLLLGSKEGKKFTEQLIKIGRKYNHSVPVSENKPSYGVEVLKGIL